MINNHHRNIRSIIIWLVVVYLDAASMSMISPGERTLVAPDKTEAADAVVVAVDGRVGAGELVEKRANSTATPSSMTRSNCFH
jgi:hypothetical protein